MIETVTDYNLEAFLSHELCALILARSTCKRCITYQDDVRRLIERDLIGNTRVGVLMLDHFGASNFKRQNLWLMGAEHLPYTMLFRNGFRIDGFSASRGHILMDRSRQVVVRDVALMTSDHSRLRSAASEM
jgi:hypothetical protein